MIDSHIDEELVKWGYSKGFLRYINREIEEYMEKKKIE
jgi:hypothetical protein